MTEQMRIALDILNKYTDFNNDSSPTRENCIKAMKEYAKLKCKEQREICSKAESIGYRMETLEDIEESRNEVLNSIEPKFE